MHRKTIAALAALLLAGCTSNSLRFKDTPEGNQSVSSLDEAGSVHVAVLAVTPWEEVKAKLRPNLKVDEKDLRNQAIPVTFALLDKYLDVLRIQAALAPNTVKTTSTSTSTSETGKDDTAKTETTTTKAPGEARKTDGPAALATGSAPAIAASAVSAINSSLTARAMASFVQDVQALNAEVDSAARRTGYDPYLMRVQVTVMPRRRHLGYDVYSNLSFFGYRGLFNTKTGAAGERQATEGTPFVVPLLSSDSIETAQRSQSIEAIRDVGVALDLVRGFGAAGFSVGSQKDRQQALAGLDVNSVLTMGRLSDNTVRVRFGAAFDPGGGFAVHPRTNTISVLVFFPKNATQSRIVSRTSWTHVMDGTVLERSQEKYVARLEPIASQWRDLGVTVEFLERIDELPLEGNYRGFEERLNKRLIDYCKRPQTAAANWKTPKRCIVSQSSSEAVHDLTLPENASEKERSFAYLWSHLLSLLPGSRFSTTIVDLPKLSPECPLGSQLAVYLEEEKGITVALRGGKELEGARLDAALHWAFLGAKAKEGLLGPSPVLLPAPRAASSAVKGKPAARATATSEPKQDAATTEDRPSLTGYGGAQLASAISIAEDRKSATLSFASEGLQPVAWSGGSEMAPVAIELSGCKSGSDVGFPAGLKGERLFGPESQLYPLHAYVPKKPKSDDKAKPAVSLSVGTTELLLYEKQPSKTKVTVDLGEKPKTAYALSAAGGVIDSVGPAANVELRPDGAYLVKSPGTLELTFINVTPSRTVDVELRPIDEKNKLGPSAFKLSLTGRSAKS